MLRKSRDDKESSRSSSQPRIAPCEAYCPITGRAPYGYRLCGEGESLAYELDPRTAPVVERIFDEYVSGGGLQQIAERLTADGILRPSAYDPQHNPHHSGSAWSKPAVRAIIVNGRYAAEHLTRGPRADCGRCGYRCASRHPVALVPVEVYRHTQDILAARVDLARIDPLREQTVRRYVLRGLLRCELCQRLMQGSWNNGAAYYRCRFPREYAKANSIIHPANVYIREDRLVEPLLEWICRSLPARLCDWATQQQPATRTRVLKRCQELRELVSHVRRDRAQSVALYGALSLRLGYEPELNVIHVRSEVVPNAVVQDDISL